MTGKQKTIRGLKRLGAGETKGTTKYDAFQQSEWKYLVGRNGALRVTNGPVSQSISLTGTVRHKAIQFVGEQNWNPEPSVDVAWNAYNEYIRLAAAKRKLIQEKLSQLLNQKENSDV